MSARGTITFEITPDGDKPFEVTATSRDLAKWESMGKSRSVASFAAGGASIQDLYQIAWLAIWRRHEAGELELPEGVTDWRTLRDTCDFVTDEEDDEDA